MPRLLLTGFDPFGGCVVNSSWQLAAQVKLDGDRVTTALLPTSFARARSALITLLAEQHPTVVLHLGLAAARQRLTFELMARNRDHSAARDNDGELRQHQPILSSAPDAYRNTLPLEMMQQLSEERGEPLDTSDDAGGFVCNHVFFHSAHWCALRSLPPSICPESKPHPDSQLRSSPRCGFVHVPALATDSERMTRVAGIVSAWCDALSR